MEALPTSLTQAALAMRDRLSVLARNAATTNASPGSSTAAGAMAAAANAAIFEDALLTAMHARLEAVKSVAK